MTLLFAFPEQAALGATLSKAADFEEGAWEWRHFPDSESYVKILSEIKSKPAIILCSLNQPDEKTLPLVFLARTLKELGAGKITLIAPYLGYMRQDKRFKEGEAITSAVFAQLLSGYVDALVTVDPHLHRYHAMSKIYSVSCTVVHAAPHISDWIAKNVHRPLLIGPDSESGQWVSDIARHANAAHIVLSKTRRGDKDVDVSIPNIEKYRDHTPVLVDDIISTAQTMIEAAKNLRSAGMKSPVCIGIHGVFAEDAWNALKAAGVSNIITTNTIPHPTNKIDIAPLLIEHRG